MVSNSMLVGKDFGLIVILFIALLFAEACNENKLDSPEMRSYVDELSKERKEKDYSMQFDQESPFMRDTSITFKPLNYYKPDPDFIFESKLNLFTIQDTVIILGTKGEKRPTIVIGYLGLNYNGKLYKVNVYKSFSRTGEEYYSIWFTDKTTGKETYGVGRYLDFELNDDPDFVYIIDFNKAYNPYCAYTPLYTCPIPRKEDHIDLNIEAGEKNFH
jgi:uncharacterized protein